MRAFALVISFLTCTGHGRRVHRLLEHLQGSMHEGGLLERHRKVQPLVLQPEGHTRTRHPESALARLLVTSNAAAGWQVSGSGHCRGSCAEQSTHRCVGRPCMGATASPEELPGARAPEFAVSRRAALLAAVAPVLAAASRADAAPPVRGKIPEISEFQVAENGLMWYELRNGSGTPPQLNQTVVIDYQMSRRAGFKIYSTKDTETPFTWRIGDGTVIPGLELGVAGGEGVPPMLPGSARRLVIPQSLGYAETKELKDISALPGGEFGDILTLKSLQPVPPDFDFKIGAENANAFKRFEELYQNKKRPNQPDLIMDVILSRSSVIPPRRKKDDDDDDED